MAREPWEGLAPVLTTRAVSTTWRETDDDGSVWYVAEGSVGEELERALVSPGGMLSNQMTEQTLALQSLEDRYAARRERLEALRDKRRKGLPWTISEVSEIAEIMTGIWESPSATGAVTAKKSQRRLRKSTS